MPYMKDTVVPQLMTDKRLGNTRLSTVDRPCTSSRVRPSRCVTASGERQSLRQTPTLIEFDVSILYYMSTLYLIGYFYQLLMTSNRVRKHLHTYLGLVVRLQYSEKFLLVSAFIGPELDSQ
jgi:hypothetical protein